jgi:rubrerythrin
MTAIKLKVFVCGFCGHTWTGVSGERCPNCEHKRVRPQRSDR